MFKILVVDDQRDMREALKAILTQGGHSVSEAENGKAAQEALELKDFDLVISDLQMPIVNGVELLAWIKTNKPVPVILVTGFAQILETQQAFDLGADEFFTKPFSYKAILKAIETLLVHKGKPTIPEDQASEFCRIPIEDFVSSAGVQINIYIKLSDSKYVRVAHKGDPIPLDRVENYKTKGLSYLYAKKEDFGRLVGFNIDLAKVLLNDKKLDAEKKLRFLRYTTELVLENVMVNGVSEKAFKEATDCLDVVLSLVIEKPNLYETLEVLNEHADWLYAHCLGVSIYSVMIGRKLGWMGQSTLFKLGLGGLFHDIGHKEISTELLNKSRSYLSLQERKILETHVSRGKEILLDLKELPEDVLQIVYEHHENCIGQGYPRRVPPGKIHPLAKIISVADRFCYLALVGPNSKGSSAQDAVQEMQTYHDQEMDKAAFNALKSLCMNTEANA